MVAWLVAIVVAMASSAWGQAGTAGSGERPLTPCARLEYGNNEAYNYNMTTIDRHLCSLAADQCFACEDLAACDLCPLVAACEGGAGGCCAETGPLTGRSRLWCDVTDPRYGAIPDDGLDDTDAFQKAFNDCVNDPILSTNDCGAVDPEAYNVAGIVYAPQGTYDVCGVGALLTPTAGQLFSGGASFVGDGPDATVLRCFTQLGACEPDATDGFNQTCVSAFYFDSDPCNSLRQDNSASSSRGSVTLRGFTLMGPGLISPASSRGVRTARTDGITIATQYNNGSLVEDVVIEGFDVGLQTNEFSTVRNSGFWSNYAHILPSNSGGVYQNLILGTAGRSAFQIDAGGGLTGARLLSLWSPNPMPYALYQGEGDAAAPTGGSTFLKRVAVDWQVNDLGNGLWRSENVRHDGDDKSSQCIGLHSPAWCCSAAATGPCPTEAGGIEDSQLQITVLSDANGDIRTTAPIPWLPADVLGDAGPLLGRNRFTVVSTSRGTPLVPLMPTGSIHYRFTRADAISGLRLHSPDPALDVVSLVDATAFARVQSCDALDTCVTLTTVSTSTSTTTTTVAPAAGEWCGTAVVIAAGGGAVAGTTVAKTKHHYPGTVAFDVDLDVGVTDWDGGDVVYSWTPTTTGSARIDTCGASSSRLQLSMRTSPCHYLAVATDEGSQRAEGQTIARCEDAAGRIFANFGGGVACAPNSAGAGCAMTVPVTAGQTYYLLVGDNAGSESAFTVNVTPP